MSGDLIHLNIDARGLRRFLGGQTNQIPFIMALIPTYIAQDAAQEAQRDLPGRFTLRRPWITKGIKWTKATKQNPVAEVGSRDYFMALQEEGGTRKPKESDRLAVPLSIRKDERVNITRAKRPKRLLEGGRIKGNKPFIQTTTKGVEGIFVRTKKQGRVPLAMLYHLRREPIVVKRRGWLRQSVEESLKKRMQFNVSRAVEYAIRTAR